MTVRLVLLCKCCNLRRRFIEWGAFDQINVLPLRRFTCTHFDVDDICRRVYQYLTEPLIYPLRDSTFNYTFRIIY